MADDRPVSEEPASPEALVEALRQLYEQVQAGRRDLFEVNLTAWSEQALRRLSVPPLDGEVGPWLEQAGEALRLLAELCVRKAELLAPPPAPLGQPAEPQGGPPPSPAADDGEPENGGEAGPQALEQAARRLELLQQAAESLARQAERFQLHQPRPQQAVAQLMAVLERLGPWPDGSPAVSVEQLARALWRVLRRQALAEQARRAPAPSLNWPQLLQRVREWAREQPTVPLERLLARATSRSELIAAFLAVLELVRLGELWLSEDEQGTIQVSCREYRPAS